MRVACRLRGRVGRAARLARALQALQIRPDIGGGLMVFVGGHVGIRGDLRYFHAFQNLNVLGFSLSDPKLDFGRASAALVLTF